MTDGTALRQLIADKGIKLKFIAEKLGISPYGLTLKLDGKNEFKAREIATMCEILNITSLKEKERIFFAQTVKKIY